MKRIALLILSVILVVAGLFLLVRVAHMLNTSGQGALQVTTNIKSDVFLNGNKLGETPLCKCNQNDTVAQGEYELKVVPHDKSMEPFTAKVKVNSGVLTAVERTFLPGSLASAYILTLEKTNSPEAQLFVASLPKEAMVNIDGLPAGATPYSEDKITPSEHEVEVQKNGFSKKTIRVRTVSNYRLNIDVLLGAESDSITPTPAEPTPAPTTALTPAPSKTEESDQPTITILTTGVGFLRVRSQPTTSSEEVTRVEPGETYEVLDEQSGWYQIKIDSRTEGWVSGRYVEENE